MINFFRPKVKVPPIIKKTGHIRKIEPNLEKKMMWKEAWEAKAVIQHM